ncbi:PA2778 family cysteine peptidase [Alteromonas sp. H39]|uniref:PA2778 family cysteine peptidase n=1 Tax=Alteromonas sp. H39 TaxID=3389876 RepID=UPI0039DF4689
MTTSLVIKACLIAGFLLLTGCTATPQSEQLRAERPSGLSGSSYIADMPFFAQQQYYCGPTTLSEVFTFYGQPVDAEDIAPKIFIPEREGSLQLEMVSATRQYGFLPYAERGTLTQLFRLVDDDIPVIVFQNLSIELLPQWHYAVVIGYDLPAGTVTLHTGVTPDHTMSFELFEKTWARGNYWYMAPLPPEKASPALDAFTYTSAAYDMLNVGRTDAALAFLASATRQWPDQWLAYFLLANHYLESKPKQAIAWFDKGYHVGQYQAAYMNNFAHVLANQGCDKQASKVLELALSRFPQDPALHKTQQAIAERTGAAQKHCEIQPVESSSVPL